MRLILREVPIFKIEMGTSLKINLVPSGWVAGLTGGDSAAAA
jgi:hypothetical protein